MSDGLQLTDLVVHRSGSPIIRGVSMTVPPGEVTVLLGANGAGKTTLLESISGVIRAASGSITLDGNDITSAPRTKRARLGLAHVEQGRAIFPDLTTEENLIVAGAKDRIEAGFELFPELANRRSTRASLLSGGQQQMLVIARALVSGPKVLMLDEMSLGLAPTIIKRLIPIVRTLAADGVGVLLVEQYAALALANGDRAYVLVRGEMAYDGPCAALQEDPGRLRSLYLGASAGISAS